MTDSDVHDSPVGVWQKIYIPVALVSAMVALVGGWIWAQEDRQRPEGSGQVGVLAVYAQTRRGPERLPPSRGGTFERPQDLAFQFDVRGTGPRWIRVRLEDPSTKEKTLLYEKLHHAPSFLEPLDYVLRLDERAPDRVDLVVTVEAPHMMAAVSRFPLLLVGGNTRFWEGQPTETATPTPNAAPKPPAPAGSP